jgi:hypothetical protein
MCEHTILLENVIFNQDMYQISRATYPGKAAPGRSRQRPLCHQCIPGIGGGEVFWQQRSVSLVLGLTPNSLQVFDTFWQLFYLKRLSECTQTVFQILAMANLLAELHQLLTFARHHRHWSSNGALFLYGYTNMDPYLLWKPTCPPPPLIIWAPAGGLRKSTARSYCTPCIAQYVSRLCKFF